MINLKRLKTAGIALITAICLSACGDVYFPNLTEEETALITEYAVDVVMRHSRGTDYRLMDNAEEELAKKRQKQAAAEALRKEKAAEEAAKQAEKEDKKNSGKSEGEVQAPAMPTASSVDSLLGLSDVSIQWTGYEVLSSYAESSGFSMEASPGKKLLVLSFYTENHSGESAYLDMTALSPVFRIGINDQAPKVADSTMLLNDLGFFRGELAPGVAEELVLIREISDSDAQGLASVKLTGEVGGTEYDLGGR